MVSRSALAAWKNCRSVPFVERITHHTTARVPRKTRILRRGWIKWEPIHLRFSATMELTAKVRFCDHGIAHLMRWRFARPGRDQ